MPPGVQTVSLHGTVRAGVPIAAQKEPEPVFGGRKTKWDVDISPRTPADYVKRPGAVIPTLAPGCSIVGGVCIRDQPVERSVKEIVIPVKDKGGLIGKGGEQINRIRNESRATVKLIYDEGDVNATIEIRGKLEEVELAEKLVLARLAELREPGTNGGWDMKTIDVPKELIGETIGIGGCNLKEMSEKSGCAVRFVQANEFDKDAPLGKQVACIRGPPEKIPDAEELLMDKISEIAELHHEKALKAWGISAEGGGVNINPNASDVPCRFHLRKLGSCKNAAQCPFSHDPAVIAAARQDMPPEATLPEYKTSYCKYWDSGRCARGQSCVYAHGVEELRGGGGAITQWDDAWGSGMDGGWTAQGWTGGMDSMDSWRGGMDSWEGGQVSQGSGQGSAQGSDQGSRDRNSIGPGRSLPAAFQRRPLNQVIPAAFLPQAPPALALGVPVQFQSGMPNA